MPEPMNSIQIADYKGKVKDVLNRFDPGFVCMKRSKNIIEQYILFEDKGDPYIIMVTTPTTIGRKSLAASVTSYNEENNQRVLEALRTSMEVEWREPIDDSERMILGSANRLDKLLLPIFMEVGTDDVRKILKNIVCAPYN